MKYSEIVDYDKLDPFKEESIRRYKKTLSHPNRLGVRIIEETLGETAVAIDTGDSRQLYAFIVEGLGTKNRVFEEMVDKLKIFRAIARAYSVSHDININNRIRQLSGGIGQCGMAMSVNDLCGIGAIPIVYEPIVATGSSNYLTDKDVSDGLIDGFLRGAYISMLGIPGGETPTLPDVVYPNTIDLAGASLGIIRPKSRLCLGAELREGVRIYGVGSSGIHSNGLSLARRIAAKLPDGFFTKLPDGRTLGEALLTPTTIYAPLIENLAIEEAEIIYGQPITGHGFGKIMRKKRDLTYVIENVPEPQTEFKFMQEKGPVSDEEAYKVWNMGIGFVLFAMQNQETRIRKACNTCNLPLYDLGPVKKGKRSVVIPSKNITYTAV